MASNAEIARIIVQFLQLRFQNILDILRDLREIENSSTDLSTVLRVFKECQNIIIKILVVPQCKMLDILMSISGQIYVTVADKIFQNDAEGFSELLLIIKNEI
jgi:hypothetical protein